MSQGVWPGPRALLLAWQFYTRLPLPRSWLLWAAYSPALLRLGAAHLPAIGMVVGAVSAGVLSGAVAVLPPVAAAPWLAVLLALAAGWWLTGALHEDGLADVADALGGHASRERALEIMKDSRLGAFGALALGWVVATKWVLLVLLFQAQPGLAGWALWAAHLTSRLMPLGLMASMDYVGQPERAKAAVATGRVSVPMACVALSWWGLGMLALLASPSPCWMWAVACAASVGMAFWWRWRLWCRLQGYTGDALGAVQQWTEWAFYLGLALAWGHA